MSLRQPAAGSFARLFLDLLVTGLVIATTLAVLLQEGAPAVFKARFINVLWGMSHERAAVMEHYAHTGAWAGQAHSVENPEASPYGPPRTYRVAIDEGSVMAAGTLSGRAFSGGMRPAVSDPVNEWSVLWLCGSRQPPAGWTAPPGNVRFTLPDRFVLSVCRERSA